MEIGHTGKPTTLGSASGALAGLVSITPAAGFVTPGSAIIIGFIGGMACYGAVLLKNRFAYDDALDVVGIHGIGGTWGALATGIWASSAVNGVDGLLYGNTKQFGIQALSVVATWGFSYGGSRLILALVGAVTPIRAAEKEEIQGLDLSEHSERGYQF